MASLEYTTLDVFTTTKFAGNPLAVVTLPTNTNTNTALTQAQKQTIAAEFNYSETTFLHPCGDPGAEVPEWRLDIFTVKEELPFAGHPVIGTACYILQNTGKAKGNFRVKAGVVELEYADGVAKASIPHHTHVHSTTNLNAAKMLEWQPGLTPFYTGREMKLAVVSPVRGMNFSMVELASLEELAAVRVPGGGLEYSLDAGWEGPRFNKFFVRMPDRGDGVVRLRTRMVEGGFEDPATGSACCGLAAYLVLREGVVDGRVRFEITQAVEMGRMSEIGVEVGVEGGVIKTVVLSGRAVRVMEGKVFYA